MSMRVGTARHHHHPFSQRSPHLSPLSSVIDRDGKMWDVGDNHHILHLASQYQDTISSHRSSATPRSATCYSFSRTLPPSPNLDFLARHGLASYKIESLSPCEKLPPAHHPSTRPVFDPSPSPTLPSAICEMSRQTPRTYSASVQLKHDDNDSKDWYNSPPSTRYVVRYSHLNSSPVTSAKKKDGYHLSDTIKSYCSAKKTSPCFEMENGSENDELDCNTPSEAGTLPVSPLPTSHRFDGTRRASKTYAAGRPLKPSSKRRLRLASKKKTSSTQARLEALSNRLQSFLLSKNAHLSHSAPNTIFLTSPQGLLNEITLETTFSDTAEVETSRRRGQASSSSRMSTHRFVLPRDATVITMCDWEKMSRVQPKEWSEETLSNLHCHFVSCVRWEGDLWISNSDICNIVKFRIELLGFAVRNREKLFEGVYSDLRTVPKAGYRYEERKSPFLTSLDKFHCISMHKRQKVYRWGAVNHDLLLNKTLRRCIEGGKACEAIQQPALQLCKGEATVESVLNLLP